MITIEFRIWIKLIEFARGPHLYLCCRYFLSSLPLVLVLPSFFFTVYFFLSVYRPVSLMASSSSGNAIPAPGTPKKLHLFTRVCVYSFDDLVSNFLFQMQYGSWYRLWLMNLLWSGKPHWLLSRTSLFCMLSPKPQPSPPPPIVPRRTSMHYFV